MTYSGSKELCLIDLVCACARVASGEYSGEYTAIRFVLLIAQFCTLMPMSFDARILGAHYQRLLRILYI